MRDLVLPAPAVASPLAGTGGYLSEETLTALAGSDTVAFLVVHRGELVIEYYGDPEAAWRAHPIRSVTKSMVGCLAGVLIGRGVIDPAHRASVYVPALNQGEYAQATVRDLLDMRTGGDYREEYPLPLTTRAELAAAGAPGPLPTSFCYRSADTDVLAWVLEAATGRDLSRLLVEEILAPIGCQGDAVMTLDDEDYALASGGLALIPRDVARFAMMLLDGGSCGEREVVPATFLRDTFTGSADSVAAFAARAAHLGPDAAAAAVMLPKAMYRNQFWIPEQGRRRMLCLGIHGQLVLADADTRTAVIKLSRWQSAVDPVRFDLGMTAAVAVLRQFGG